jgi:hypothetical protein
MCYKTTIRVNVITQLSANEVFLEFFEALLELFI